MATTLAFVLLWFAGELEQCASGEMASAEVVSSEREGEGGEESEEETETRPGAAPPIPSELFKPVQCRWCRQKVIPCPGRGMLNEDGSIHQCGSFPASRVRKKRGHTPSDSAGASS